MATSKKPKIVTKVTIGIPYEVGTTEYENFMDTIGEMNRDNSYEYTIEVCKLIESKLYNQGD